MSGPRRTWRLVFGLAMLGVVAAAFWGAVRTPTQPLPASRQDTGAQRPAGAAAGAFGTASTAISGRVALSPALQPRVSPEDTVLIVARVLDGPRMPVAVLKRSASELPLDFKLDESAATTPTLRLSPSMQLVVAARILRAGQATAEPGDLLGTAQPVPVGTHGLAIEINGSAP